MSTDSPPRKASSGRRWAYGAAVAVALLAGASLISWLDRYALVAESRTLADEEIGLQCKERLAFSDIHLAGQPVQRFVARDGEDQARVYVSEVDNWIIVCQKDSLGIRVMGARMEQESKEGIHLFDADDAVLKSNLVIGRVPPGATAIQARLTSGRMIAGSHDNDVFVVWSANDSVRGARLTAARADGSPVAEATAPSDF